MAGSKKTQQELEQPAKVYQFEALKEQLDRVESLAQTLVTESKNQVSAKYFEDRLAAQATAFNQSIKALDSKQTVRVDDLEKEVTRNSSAFNNFAKAVIGVGLAIVTSAIGIIWLAR